MSVAGANPSVVNDTVGSLDAVAVAVAVAVGNATRCWLVPSPSWPAQLDPQQYAVPPATRPQVCAAPATSAVKVRPPLTATGAVRLAELSPSTPLVPSPSWPYPFRPQQYAVPPVARPHVCAPPATSAVYVRPPLTGNGTSRLVTVPSPSSPDPLYPQQYAVPPVARPQV